MTAVPDVTVSDTPPGCEPGGEWLPLAQHGLSKYEVWSTGGYGRDQRPVRRASTGQLMAVSEGTQRRNVHKRGYLQVKLYNDDGKQVTRTVHSLVLLVNVGPPPEGMQTRHLGNDPWDNRWAPGDEAETKAAGGNLIYGTAPEQHKDKVKAGTVAPPAFECVNRCGRTASFEGARCVDCLTDAGVRAAALLSEGMPLRQVTRKLGYKPESERWVFAAACQYGKYKRAIEQARSQRRPPLVRRVLGRFRRGRK